MPQFLKTRYNETVAMIMAILWLFIYIFVNLTSILYLGAVAISGLLAKGNEYRLPAYRHDCAGCFFHLHYAGWYESDRIYRRHPGNRPDHRRTRHFLYGTWIK